MRRWSRYAGPGLDCIRLRSVGCRKHTKKQANLQGDGKEAGRRWNSPALVKQSERLDHREDHDEDHQDGRYLVENTEEFRGFPAPVGGEFADVFRQDAVHAASCRAPGRA